MPTDVEISVNRQTAARHFSIASPLVIAIVPAYGEILRDVYFAAALLQRTVAVVGVTCVHLALDDQLAACHCVFAHAGKGYLHPGVGGRDNSARLVDFTVTAVLIRPDVYVAPHIDDAVVSDRHVPL